jgi:hypothetical protein
MTARGVFHAGSGFGLGWIIAFGVGLLVRVGCVFYRMKKRFDSLLQTNTWGKFFDGGRGP